MKTFEQFRAWMKDNHLWDEYLYEFYAYREIGRASCRERV